MAPGQSVLKLVKTEEGFQFTLTVEEEKADLLEIGEQVKLNLKAMKKKGVEGTITEIKEPDNSDGAGLIRVGMTEREELKGRSRKRRSSFHYRAGASRRRASHCRVAKTGCRAGAGHSQRAGQERQHRKLCLCRSGAKSALGNTYRAQKAYLMTGEENGDEIIILGGISDQDSIIADSSEPLEDGNRVRVE